MNYFEESEFEAYVGCFIDGQDRDFDGGSLLSSNSMTVDVCRQHCQENYPQSSYFSVQASYRA